MGRKLDLSGLSDNEAEHVLQVVQRDMKLRKKEEERLSELKQELDDEGSRSLLLSRQGFFNQRCCIRCCSPFTFLLNPRRKCHDCKYNVCKACRVYCKREKAWLCSSCEKSRLLRTQSLEWFYTNVKTRFKRFGSAKVLKTLYRKHLVEHSALSELTEGSAYEESIGNEGSICGSDSAFYRQSEEHSMEETLTVALRVAEEAIDEAIAKAEFDTSSQEKQNEAHYLREHKGELVEELAKTIVQKIINRRKTLADMRAEYVRDWPVEHNTNLHHHHQAISSVKPQPGLFRSHSAYSLLENEPPGVIQDASQSPVKEGGGTAMTAWKSVDRLDNAGVSPVLHSMDGNWIALQSAQLSRPSLLIKRKSQVYSALEKESAVVSAYEGLGSDNETKPDPESPLGAAIQEIQKKMMDSNINLQDTSNRILSPLMNRRDSKDRILSPMMGRRGSRDKLLSDAEGNWKSSKPLLGVIKMKVPGEIRRPSSRRTSIIDVNFNMEETIQEEHKAAAEPEVRKVERLLKNTSEKESPSSVLQQDYSKIDNPLSDTGTPDTLISGGLTTPESESDITGQGANQMNQELTLKLQELARRVPDVSAGEEEKEVDGGRHSGDRHREEKKEGNKNTDEDEWRQRVENESDGGRTEDEDKEDDDEINYRLNKLVAQSRLTYFSSTDDELNKVSPSEEESEGDKDEDMEDTQEEPTEESTNGFTYKLCQLEKEVRANQFSSTEDEMDRVGVADEEKTEEEDEKGKSVELALKVCRLAYQVNANQFSSTEDELDSAGLLDEDVKRKEEEGGKNEELALKVCRLAHQVNANQFSSTEDELDRVGIGEQEEEAADEETLWKLQAEKAVQAAKLRDLASLVGASDFSSTEDQLDKVGVAAQEAREGGGISMWEDAEGNPQDKEESFEDLDVNMFDLKDEIEEKKKANGDGKVTSEDVLDGQPDEKNVEGKRNGTEVFKEDDKAIKTEELQEMELKPVEKGEKKEDTKLEYQPERREEDKAGDSSDSPRSWETAEEEHTEEYAEFDRIISSMLMMTLEDMQAPTTMEEASENGNSITEPEQVQAEKMVKKEEGSGLTQVEVKENDRLNVESGFVQVEEQGNVKKEKGSLTDQGDMKESVKLGVESGFKQEKVDKNVKKEVESVSAPVQVKPSVKKEVESVLEPVQVKPNMKKEVEGVSEQVQVKPSAKKEVESVSELVQVKASVKKEVENVSEPVQVKASVKKEVENVSEPVQVKASVKKEVESLLEQVQVKPNAKKEAESVLEQIQEKTNVKKEVERVLEKVQVKSNVKKELERVLVQVEVKENIKLYEQSEFKQGKVDENFKKEGKSGSEVQAVEAQSVEVQKKMTSEKELKSPRKVEIQELAAKTTAGGNISGKEESGGATSVKQKEEKKKDTTPQVNTTPATKSTVMSIKEMLETFEAKQLCKRIGLHEDGQEDRGGKISALRQMMASQGNIVDTKEKTRKVHHKLQRRRSSLQEVYPSPQEIQIDSDMELYNTIEFISTLLAQRYSAVSLRNVTTEVLKVLNTTEDLLQGVKGGEKRRASVPSLPPDTDPKKLDQQFSKLEEKVYVAAGSVYGLEAELSDLEVVARSISGTTSDMELSFLEEQVASAAAKVEQSEQTICDISSRIAALKNAGLNVDTQSRPAKTKTIPVMPVTLDSSRQFRRRLPAPPVKADKET